VRDEATVDGGPDNIVSSGTYRGSFGSIPLAPRIRECADMGEPIVWAEPDSLGAQTILRIARAIAATKREQGIGIVKALPVLS